MSKTMTVGPFTWRGREFTEGGKDYPEEEVWDLDLPELGTRFCLKNYGPRRPRPGGGVRLEFEAFSGWRLVSGGPFVDAGCWTTRDEAMEGVVAYLANYCAARVEQLLGETEETQRRIEVLREKSSRRTRS